jgi:hypothetical protein
MKTNIGEQKKQIFPVLLANLGACTVKHFTVVINLASHTARVFVTVGHFYPFLIFAGKAESYLR